MAAAKLSFRELITSLAEDELVRVESYAGYREEEKPQRIIVRDNAFPVDKVLEIKRELRGGQKDWVDVFICLVEGEKVKLERQASGRWRLKKI